MKKFFERLNLTDIRNIIAVIYVVMVLGYIYVLAFKAVPGENKDLVNVLGGVVIGGVTIILSFFFGSSKNGNNNNDPKPTA
jgi:hypothetical protein